MTIIKNNSPVLFFYNNSKKWLAKISKKESVHTHIGVLKHADAIGKEYGSRLMTNHSCPTLNTYVNNNTQDNYFEEMALYNGTNISTKSIFKFLFLCP